MQMCFSKSAQHHSKVKQRNSLLEIMENCFEMMVARCIKIGTVQTLTMLGLLPKVVTISQAEDIYGKRLITQNGAKKPGSNFIRQIIRNEGNIM